MRYNRINQQLTNVINISDMKKRIRKKKLRPEIQQL